MNESPKPEIISIVPIVDHDSNVLRQDPFLTSWQLELANGCSPDRAEQLGSLISRRNYDLQAALDPIALMEPRIS